MKKLLFVLAVLFIQAFQSLKAQNTIPNPDFETWTDDALTGWPVKDPNRGSGTTGWWDFNFFNSFFAGGSPITVFQDSANPSPYSGKYCAKIISDTLTAVSQSYLNGTGLPKIVGLIYAGNVNPRTQTVIVGFPINVKLQSFSFEYRYIPNGIDSCFCEIAVYHWNAITKKSEEIGLGKWWNNNKVSVWSPATVNIGYNSASTPDTIAILFSACSLFTPKMYDTMNIDNISYAITGINDVDVIHDKVTVYPNPANSEINLVISGQVQASRVEIYDITGNLIGAYSIYNNHLAINTQPYKSGVYFYKLLDNTGTQLNVGNFYVIR